MKTQESIQSVRITLTFDGEVYSAWVEGKEVSTDRSLGQLKVRTRKRYGHVIFIEKFEEVK